MLLEMLLEAVAAWLDGAGLSGAPPQSLRSVSTRTRTGARSEDRRPAGPAGTWRSARGGQHVAASTWRLSPGGRWTKPPLRPKTGAVRCEPNFRHYKRLTRFFSLPGNSPSGSRGQDTRNKPRLAWVLTSEIYPFKNANKIYKMLMSWQACFLLFSKTISVMLKGKTLLD